MNINIIDNLMNAATSYAKPLIEPSLFAPSDDEAAAQKTIVSKSSYTRYDGSVVTTILYSDGTTKTETTEGDTVTLSSAAQAKLAA